MKRNSKGFTLVELLAAIVILGILVGVSVPIIVSMLDTSKSKMYITDAKKLLAQAEYKMNAASSEIEKPDEGDCIIISMLYMDSAVFDTPPGEGQYEKESSYVVVKNVGGELEYSVATVEKVKRGGYRGVELVKKSKLTSNNSISYVISYKKNDVLNVETDVNRGFINDKLGKNYISNENKISAVYNYPNIADNAASTTIPGAPKIVYASFASASNLSYNSLDAMLQMKVEDKDTDLDKLKVYISVDSGYTTSGDPVDYGNGDLFTYNIDFARHGYNYDASSAKVYVVVEDPDGHTDRKTITYKIHKNVAPEIDAENTWIGKRENDKFEMTVALVKLSVVDDIDAVDDLKVCLMESPDDENFESCSTEYKNYNDYFSDIGTMEYQFVNCPGDKCRRDGSTHWLTLFLRDRNGGVSSIKLEYTFSINEMPQIKANTFSVESNGVACKDPSKCPANDGGSKHIIINIDITDDLDEPNDIRLIVSDGYSSPRTIRYNSDRKVYFTLSGFYNGATRNIKVKALDSEDGYSEEEVEQKYKLYLNQVPKFVNTNDQTGFDIVSSTPPCANSELCTPEDSGGNKMIKAYLNVEDDVDYEALTVCFSVNNPNRCDGLRESYIRYDKTYGLHTLPVAYEGQTITVYAFVYDNDLGVTVSEPITYKLYTNQPPSNRFDVTFTSTQDKNPKTGNLKVNFAIDNVADDVDDERTLRFEIIEDGIIREDAPVHQYISNMHRTYTLSGNYDGKKRNIEIKLIDSDGATASKYIEYQVYENKKPSNVQFNVYSKNIACLDEMYCPLEESGNNTAYYTVSATDDIDSNEELQVCVSEYSDQCYEYSSYSEYAGGIEHSYTFNSDNPDTPYDGSEKTLYVHVKDTQGEEVTKSYKYKIYQNRAPIISDEISLVSNSEDGINIPNITYSVDAVDDLDEALLIKYCYKKNGGSEVCTDYENYGKTKVLGSNFFGTSVPNGATYVIYSKVIDSYEQETKSKEITYKLYNDNTPSIHSGSIISGTRLYKDGNGNEVSSLDEVTDPNEVENYHEYTRLKVGFSVDDPHDTFSVCVSENASTCANMSSKKYSANNCTSLSCDNPRNTYYTYYDKSGFIEEGAHLGFYLFVEDSYHKTTSSTLYSGDYTKCTNMSEEKNGYEYIFNSELTNQNAGHTNPISIDRCAGKCYYRNPSTSEINNIVAWYTTKITYFDKFNSKFACNENNPETMDYEATCDFKDCFYKESNYSRKAIGTREIEDDDPWTTTVNGNEYTCTGHYTLYLSSYTDGDMSVTLNQTNIRICNTALDHGEYNYDSSSYDPFIRVAD